MRRTLTERSAEAAIAWRGIDRRQFLVGTGAAVVFGHLAIPRQGFAQAGDFPEFRRYFSSRLDPQANLWVVQAIDFTLSQSTTVAQHNLLVLADTLTIDGDLTLPGRNITLVTRILTIKGGAAKLSTVGTTGVPSYTNQVAPQGQAGARDTGAGKPGGDVAIFATSMFGTLTIDTSGGTGGDAQKGGKGMNGSDGRIGTFSTAPTAAGDGLPGMAAGKPGDGGDAGALFLLTEQAAAAAVLTAVGGNPGAQSSNGEPGGPGAQAPAVGGIEEYDTLCPTIVQ